MSNSRLAYLLEGHAKHILDKNEIIELRELTKDLEEREKAGRLAERKPAMKEVMDNEEPSVAVKLGVMNGLEEAKPVVRVMPMATWLRVAIAVVIIITGAGIWIGLKPKAKQELSHQARITDRYMVLPDSTTVIVHAGGKLEYKEGFNTSTREVTLTGEAYFDVKQDSRRPFIIHTGTVRTTVLGTAFLVKAYPGTKAVTVTVSSGKVRVENEKQVLGELIKDQQLVYRADAVSSEQKEVSAVKEMNWVSKGMDFQSAYFGNVTEALEQRYGVAIVFANPAQANCQMTASFTGTESIETVLQILCSLTGSTYRQEGKVITITGKECND
jgi:ferric-dicitrate binding protein FerR (iron transport regulator)